MPGRWLAHMRGGHIVRSGLTYCWVLDEDMTIHLPALQYLVFLSPAVQTITVGEVIVIPAVKECLTELDHQHLAIVEASNA